jgi:hypothetical protein
MNGRVLQVLVTATVPIDVRPVAWAAFVQHAALLAAVGAHPNDPIAQMAVDGIRAHLLSRDDTP